LTYNPKPINTTGVKLPRQLLRLVEGLAENNHDLWAQKRIAEGWTYGPSRDDTKKTHPDLIPYDDLPDSEKEYDRTTALEVAKAIVALGYKIDPPRKKPSSNFEFAHAVAQEALARLRSSEELDLATLTGIWATISSEHWAGFSKIYELLGHRILKIGEPLLAYDVISAGLSLRAKNVRLRQLMGLALARSGATERANLILSQLYEEGKIDGETLGILARTHKDLWAMATDPAEKARQLGKAYDYYDEGYGRAVLAKKKNWLDEAIYNGINAASTALLTKREAHAKTLALELYKICQEKLKRGRKDYWALASLGEAAIILGDWIEAEDRYSAAAEVGRGNFADLSSTRHQARILHSNEGI